MTNNQQITETDRLILQEPSVEYFENFLAFWMEPEPDYPAFSPNQLNTETAWARLLRHIGHWNHFGYGACMVIEKTSGRMIGEVGMAWFRRDVSPTLDRGPEGFWRISADSRGENFASEAIKAVIELADHEWAIASSFAVINRENALSARLATNFGYLPKETGVYKSTDVIIFERVNS